MGKEDYSKKLRLLTKSLREMYYITGKDKDQTVPSEPNQLNAKQGLGNFPAFYLEGHHCEKSDCGNCTNCFYSQYYSEEPTPEQIKAQCDYVLEHFEELVLKEQYGINQFPEERKQYPDKKPIFMTFSPTGSFFSDKEFPKDVRLDFLKKLTAKSEELRRDIVLHIEAHAKDVVKQSEYISTSEESEYLRKLHAKCILGFESSDEWSRNVLYNKSLSLEKFEKAVGILKNAGIDVGAFVFSGLITHTDREAKTDMVNSVKYLKNLEFFPVLMFANAQSWTVPDVLIQAGKHKLQEPFTVLDTVYDVMDVLTENGKVLPEYYLIPEPVDGPPYPEKNIFFNRDDLQDISNVDGILSHQILSDFRKDRDIQKFQNSWANFRRANCNYLKYLQKMQKQEKSKIPLEERLNDVIETTKINFKKYVDERMEKDQEEKEDIYKGHVCQE